jgi:hypothetical protein
MMTKGHARSTLSSKYVAVQKALNLWLLSQASQKAHLQSQDASQLGQFTVASGRKKRPNGSFIGFAE